jgi:hypothetical protein
LVNSARRVEKLRTSKISKFQSREAPEEFKKIPRH